MRLRALALLAVLLAALAPSTGAQTPRQPENATSFPGPDEAVEPNPTTADPISWYQTALAVVFLAAATGVLLYLWRASRSDRRRAGPARRKR